jgi:hypothetical protein
MIIIDAGRVLDCSTLEARAVRCHRRLMAPPVALSYGRTRGDAIALIVEYDQTGTQSGIADRDDNLASTVTVQVAPDRR